MIRDVNQPRYRFVEGSGGDDVAALVLYYRGQRVLTMGPGYPSWPTIHFVAQSRVGYEVEVRVKETPGSAPRRWVEESEQPQPDLLRLAGPSLVAPNRAREALPPQGSAGRGADGLRRGVHPRPVRPRSREEHQPQRHLGLDRLRLDASTDDANPCDTQYSPTPERSR